MHTMINIIIDKNIQFLKLPSHYVYYNFETVSSKYDV